jgi:hypothetical protein
MSGGEKNPDKGMESVPYGGEYRDKETNMEERKIVRTNRAGVFFGKITNREGDTVTMTNARRLWYWDGAASLSELAQHGTASAGNCKFPCPVDEVEVFEVIEILSVTDEAAASIDGVRVWTQR